MEKTDKRVQEKNALKIYSAQRKKEGYKKKNKESQYRVPVRSTSRAQELI